MHSHDAHPKRWLKQFPNSSILTMRPCLAPGKLVVAVQTLKQAVSSEETWQGQALVPR